MDGYPRLNALMSEIESLKKYIVMGVCICGNKENRVLKKLEKTFF